jgi:hypothetical protein
LKDTKIPKNLLVRALLKPMEISKREKLICLEKKIIQA